MKKLVIEFSLVSVFFLVYVFLLPQNPELWRHQLNNGMVFASIVIALALGKTARSSLVAIAASYFLVHAVTPWAASPLINAWQNYQAVSGYAFLLAIAVCVSLFDRVGSYRILNTLALLCFISSTVMLVKKALGLQPFFFMNNAAADASIIAALYPALALRPWWPMQSNPWLSRIAYVVPILAVGISGSTTGAVAMAAGVLAWAFAARKDPIAQLAFGAAGVTAVCAIAGALLFSPDGFLSDSGRYHGWNRSIVDWWANVDVWRGSGTGSFYVEGPKLQIAEACTARPELCDPVPKPEVLTNLFAFMHNDYLQILREQGLVGLALFLAICFVALRKSLDRPWLFSALFTYGVIMLAQYPLRFFASAIIGAFLLREAFVEEKKNA